MLWLWATLLVAFWVRAEEYFRVAPGPLNQGHATWDNSDGCPKCHNTGEGVTNQKCLSCHGNLNHKGGLHPTFGSKPCIQCHTEHKGRNYSIIDWGKVGGRDNFAHDKVGFSLKNHHARVACTKCHVARLRTGRTSFLGLSPECRSCHARTHQFSRAELTAKCDICHSPGKSLSGMRLKDWASPHGRYSGLSFEGKHLESTCVRCHENAAMPGRSPPRSCANCHVPNHPVTPRVTPCTNCHSQTGTFQGAQIDHAKYGFTLVGRHKSTGCRSCHKPGSGSRKGVRSCVDCHKATHPVVAATANCQKCHVSGQSFRGSRIDHGQFGMPLLGAHQPLRCQKCHNAANRRLYYSEGACTNCHTHRSAHDGQFADKACASCHIEGGKRTHGFDHTRDTKFPLVGFHAELALQKKCESCHPNGRYRTGKTRCLDCHKDKHRGKAGQDCERCHSPTLRFNAPRSKEIPHLRFVLEGKHKAIACIACHPNDQYDLGHKDCVDCHKKDDVHRGKLGNDCGKCHRPEKGAPKFNHDLMTKFPRTGAHQKPRCATCHQPRPRSAAPRTLAQWRQKPPARFDRKFPVYGKRCRDCHSDPHQGSLGQDCAGCHRTTHFSSLIKARARLIRPKNHGAGWLRLHSTLPDPSQGSKDASCALCHGSPSCQNCHHTRPPRSHTALFRIKTHGRAASFEPSTCRACHQTASCTSCHRRTAPLNHRGAWPTMHGYAAGGFGSNTCSVCHRRADCAACHRAP